VHLAGFVHRRRVLRHRSADHDIARREVERNLALTLLVLGDLAGARDLQLRTYDTSRRVLGENHPDTLTSAANLAFTLYTLGDRGTAITLLSQVVMRRNPQDPSLPNERAALGRWQSVV
jgi:Flp pilus assembly protein TadD